VRSLDHLSPQRGPLPGCRARSRIRGHPRDAARSIRAGIRQRGHRRHRLRLPAHRRLRRNAAPAHLDHPPEGRPRRRTGLCCQRPSNRPHQDRPVGDFDGGHTRPARSGRAPRTRRGCRPVPGPEHHERRTQLRVPRDHQAGRAHHQRPHPRRAGPAPPIRRHCRRTWQHSDCHRPRSKGGLVRNGPARGRLRQPRQRIDRL
jgi:hypothetical protein